MKKTITAVFALFCLVGMLAGCLSITQSFLIETPQKIVITSISGEKIEIVDEDMIQQITKNITSIQFKRGESSRDMNGFGPIVSWYDSNDDVIETISVTGKNTIMYNNYFWMAVDGSIDIENINILLSNTPVSIPERAGLTLETVKELAQKGETLSWSDFEQYSHKDIGSGLYIYLYDIDENYCLVIGGGNTQSAPMYIRLVFRAADSEFIDDGEYIDIRTESIDDFINGLSD